MSDPGGSLGFLTPDDRQSYLRSIPGERELKVPRPTPGTEAQRVRHPLSPASLLCVPLLTLVPSCPLVPFSNPELCKNVPARVRLWSRVPWLSIGPRPDALGWETGCWQEPERERTVAAAGKNLARRCSPHDCDSYCTREVWQEG